MAQKKALVFGGTSGIGLATAKLLVERGVDVVAFGRSQDKIAAAAAQLSPLGSFAAEQADVLDRAALQAAFARHAGFDYLVCAATGGPRAMGPFLEMDMDGFRASFAKLWGHAHCARLGVPRMATDGAVVLVSGTPARRCRAGQVALSCVGGAVENLVRALAVEVAPRRVNGISPGVVDTPMFDKMGAEKTQKLAAMTASHPVARPGTPEEVAAGIVFALENTFMTGSILEIDGGLVVAPPK